MARLWRALWHTEVRGAEVAIAVTTLVWAIWLLSGLADFESASVYEAMGTMACERFWGLLALALAVGILFSQPVSRRRRLALFASALLWATVAGAQVYSNAHALAPALYLSGVALSMWCYIRETWSLNGEWHGPDG